MYTHIYVIKGCFVILFVIYTHVHTSRYTGDIPFWKQLKFQPSIIWKHSISMICLHINADVR